MVVVVVMVFLSSLTSNRASLCQSSLWSPKFFTVFNSEVCVLWLEPEALWRRKEGEGMEVMVMWRGSYSNLCFPLSSELSLSLSRLCLLASELKLYPTAVVECANDLRQGPWWRLKPPARKKV